MKRICFAAIAAASLPMSAASAQTALPDLPAGTALLPQQNLYLYQAPPSATFRKPAAPDGILDAEGASPQYFPLQQTAQGLMVGDPTTAGAIVAGRHVDVLRTDEVQRWVEIRNGSSPLGWAACDVGDITCSSLGLDREDTQ